MKKKLISMGMVIVLLLLLLPTTFANAETPQSYKEIIDDIISTYGYFEENVNHYATGLIYGDFIDFDNDNIKEMMLIYKNKNDNSPDAPWANILIYTMVDDNIPRKRLQGGVYGSLGQTDLGYEIFIRDVDGQKQLLFNSKKEPISYGDSENITMFTMNNKNIEIKEYYGEVLPWWDTYEFKYTKCMIDSKPVSEEEYTGNLYSFYNNSQRINLLLGKDFDNFSFCSKEKLNKFLEEAKNISNTQNTTTIAGTLRERYIKDGSGKDVQCLILTLDTPQNFQATDMFGETFTATDVREVQVTAKNYISGMDGVKVKISSYDETFEGHTAYHIRPIVISGAVIEILEKGITVTLDGKEVIFDQPPVVVNGRTLVPLRAIFEKLGATVNWDGNTQTVTSTKGQTTISMSIGKTEMYKNGKLITLDVVPQLVGGRTLVPVRAVAEGFDCKVDWDGDNQTVIIKTIDTEKVINAAKNLYQANEDMGGVNNLATYAEVDALLYNSLNEIDKTLAENDCTLDMVSASTTATIAAAKVSTGNYSSIDNIGDGLNKLLSSKEIADAADGVLKDAIKQRVFNEISSSVPDANAFVLNLGRSAYDRNSKMIQEFIVLHSKFKSGNYTYDDAVAYIVMHDTLVMNRKTMSMAVEVLSDELPQNFLESLLMSTEASAKAVLSGLFGDAFSGRNMNVGAELLTDIISAYTDYKCGEGVDFFKYMKQINHPAINEWVDDAEMYNSNLAQKLNVN